MYAIEFWVGPRRGGWVRTTLKTYSGMRRDIPRFPTREQADAAMHAQNAAETRAEMTMLAKRVVPA